MSCWILRCRFNAANAAAFLLLAPLTSLARAELRVPANFRANSSSLSGLSFFFVSFFVAAFRLFFGSETVVCFSSFRLPLQRRRKGNEGEIVVYKSLGTKFASACLNELTELRQ
jgi:hypothetical protein